MHVPTNIDSGFFDDVVEWELMPGASTLSVSKFFADHHFLNDSKFSTHALLFVIQLGLRINGGEGERRRRREKEKKGKKKCGLDFFRVS
jgi:hypothetical protein